MVGKFAGLPVWDRVPPVLVGEARAGSVLGVPGSGLSIELRRVRRRLLRLVGSVLAAGIVLGGVGFFVGDVVGWVLGLGALVVGFLVVRGDVRDSFADARRFSAGLVGEQRIGGVLSNLGSGLTVVHSVSLAGSGLGDVDHVVVGPGGVAVVDAKLWGGSITRDSSGVRHDGKILGDLASGSVRRAEALRDRLGLVELPHVIVAFAGSGGSGLRSLVSWGGVHWVASSGLGGLVRSLVGSGSVSASEVERVAGAAARLCAGADDLVGSSGLYLRVVEGNPVWVRWSWLLRAWDGLVGSLSWFGWLMVSVGLLGWASAEQSVNGLLREPLRSAVTDDVGWLVGCLYVAGGLFLAQMLFSRERLQLPFVRVAPFRVTAAGEVPLLDRSVDADDVEVTVPNPVAPNPRSVDVPRNVDEGNQLVVAEPKVDAAVTVRDSSKPKGGGSMMKKRMSADEAWAFFESRLVLPPATMEQVIQAYLVLADVDGFRKEWGQEPSKGLILHGPPGTGKTHTARAIAEAAGFEFFPVTPSELRSKWVGESAAWIRDLYLKARAKSPSVIFLDELDAVGAKRSGGGDGGASEANHALNQLLQEIDGLRPTLDGDKPPVVFTMGTTNRLDVLDPALRSRLSTEVWVGLPNADGRKRLWEMHLPKGTVQVKVSSERLAELSERMCGRTIASACRKIAEIGFARRVKIVDEELAFEAITVVRSEVDEASAGLRG